MTVYEDSYGISRCGYCRSELSCNDSGDMPDACPNCQEILDWSFYKPESSEKAKE